MNVVNPLNDKFMKKNRTCGLSDDIGLLKMIKLIRFTIFILLLSLSQTFAINPFLISSSKPEIIKEAVTQAQKAVSGKVTDSSGAPLTGVTVVIKGTTIGIITDSDGKYSLSNVPPGAILVFSFVGMKAQEVVVAGKTNLSVVLEEETVGVDEVVIVAYGTQKKVTVTGAVSSLVAKELKQSPSANFVGAMAGRLPGLITVQNSGQPGAEGINIYLRGVSTTNGQNPLILIDGVPRDNITTIDPNEVASVSILKDASSTAVFGVRGANGVILITTKRGTTETPQINVTAEYGLQDFTRRNFQGVDSWDFARLRNEALANNGLPPEFSPESIEKYKSGVDRFMYPNTNWFKLLVRPSPLTRYNVNVSGGTDRVKYFMNAGFTHQGGMFNTEPKSKLGYDPQFKMDRYNFRTNLDININSWIKSSVNLAGYIEKTNAPNSQDNSGNPDWIVTGIFRSPPTMPGPLTIDGYGVPAGEVISSPINDVPSYGQLNRTGFRNTESSNLQSSVAFDFDLSSITKGLTSKAMVSFDSRSNSITKAYHNYIRYRYSLIQVADPVTGEMKDQLTFTPNTTPQFYPLQLSKTTSFTYAINMQWAINYARTFNNKHQVTGMILAQRDNNEAVSGSSDLLLPYNVLGVAARATYGYDNRYLLEFNAGYNGSEQFQRDRRFGFFPAASLGWVISNEQFMKAQKIVTNLKLRASYGKVGNDELGDARFLYLDNLSVSSGGGFSPSLGIGKYINENLIGNPMITWETAYKQNYGLEMTLFKDLTFTGDLFFEDRKDILITRATVPALQGLPLGTVPKANMGEVTNKGFELELVYKKRVNKDLSFFVSGNYNFNQNTVKNIDEPPYDDTYAYQYQRTGYSLSQQWGKKIDWESLGKGYYTSKEEINNSGLTFTGVQPRPGDFVYKDLNGDKIIDVKDNAPIEYGIVPRVTYGVNLSVSYKGFDFSALIQGVAQTSRYYSSYGINEPFFDGNFSEYHRTAWTIERYEAGEKITYPALSTVASYSTTQNDFFIMDRSYTRLKNAEIGYTLPQHLSKRIGIRKMRVYTNGQNIFLWDKLLTKNYDPEQSNALSIPILRVFNLGVNIVF
jgi:TonB-linked SusC/RagA family outer membrane protein